MRRLACVMLALFACEADSTIRLAPGEVWASEDESLAGILAVLESGIKPNTVAIASPTLRTRVLGACHDRGLQSWAPGEDRGASRMHLAFERVVRHAPDVLIVRYRSEVEGAIDCVTQPLVRWEDGWIQTLHTRAESFHPVRVAVHPSSSEGGRPRVTLAFSGPTPTTFAQEL